MGDGRGPFGDAEIAAFPAQVRRGSMRHAIASVALCAAIAAWERAMGAGPGALSFVFATGVFLVAVNARRIRQARDAERSRESCLVFIAQHRESHLRRRRVSLIVIPVAVVGAGVSSLTVRHGSALYWGGVIAASAFLVGGWFVWYRALPRIERWPKR